MNLTEQQKKFLRGRGHQLKPMIMIGDAGLSDAVLAEYESTLDHHDDSSAQLIQRIGNVALLFRQNLKKKPEKRIRIPAG